MKSVVRRTLVGALLVASVALVFWSDRHAPPGFVPWLAAALLGCLGAAELGRMHAGRLPRTTFVVPALLCAVAAAPLEVLRPIGPRAQPLAWYAAALVSSALLAALQAAWVRGPAPPAGATRVRPGRAALLGAWAVPPLFLWTAIDEHHALAGMFLLIVLSKVGDVFGYFVGRAIGVRHPFPGISPNKTVAGCVASLLAGVAVGALLAFLEEPFAWRAGILGGTLAGLCLNLAAQAGDLFESAVKRRAGVKDSGTLFGPSGGVLDVTDSLLATTPLAILLFRALL